MSEEHRLRQQNADLAAALGQRDNPLHRQLEEAWAEIRRLEDILLHGDRAVIVRELIRISQAREQEAWRP